MADKYEEMARQMRADGVSEEMIARFVAEEMEEDEFRRSKGVTEIEAQGQPFDPEKHNAVMHIDDENLGENVVSTVYQKGFALGEKVLRFATVVVAN